MKRKIYLIVLVLVACAISGFIGWSTGNVDRAGYELRIAEIEAERDWFQNELVAHSPYITISPSEQEIESHEDWERELIDRIIDGINTANITIEFDKSGYYKGFISIYYDRPIDTTTWIFEPETEFEDEYELEYKEPQWFHFGE